jgi:hypothetical protein
VDAPIVAALITSSASVVIAISGVWWAARQSRKGQEQQRNLADAQSRSQIELEKLKHELDQSAKIEERSSVAKIQLDRYREPLLAAANELGDRIDNIRNRSFLFYLTVQDQRAETALQSTLYRFAQYFAYTEILYTNVSIMRFESDVDTKAVASLLRAIAGIFATDSLDWSEISNSPRLMLWREEQRAIGELMWGTSKEGMRACAGYASFANDYDRRFAKWFVTFAEDLKAGDAVDSERLARLQEILAKLVIQLDEDRTYMQQASDGSFMWPGWVARAAKEPN